MYMVLLSPRTSPLIPNFGIGCRWVVRFTFPRHFYDQDNSPHCLWRFCSGLTGERDSITYCLIVPVGPKKSLGALEQKNILPPSGIDLNGFCALFPDLARIATAWSCTMQVRVADRQQKPLKLTEWRKRRNIFIFIRSCCPSSPYWPGRNIWHSGRV